MSELRDLVLAWEKQATVCSQAFEVASTAIARELNAIGGYATTSPDKDNCCSTFLVKVGEKGWLLGAARVGDNRTGAPTPHHPDVGDRCEVLSNVWRKEAMALGAAQNAVRACVKRLTGATDLEHVALALLRSEREAP